MSGDDLVCQTCEQPTNGTAPSRCYCDQPRWAADVEFTPFGRVPRSCDFTADGCSDDTCDYCYGGLRELPQRMCTLAANLAIGAALCRAFWQGEQYVFEVEAACGENGEWRPGCYLPKRRAVR